MQTTCGKDYSFILFMSDELVVGETFFWFYCRGI